VDRLRGQGRRKQGRSQLRGEDCVRRDIHKLGVVGEWREFSEDRREVEEYLGQGRAEA